ncbi:unnamed protein product [Schistosoma curassoni]|uniref:Uncharacterized protein n=1 Tax=Schistosoma curassoni TaxID=6186 RepID=A0A183KHW5_9TREM|nr:unnamed protein product [Schistosoma curassoni]
MHIHLNQCINHLNNPYFLGLKNSFYTKLRLMIQNMKLCWLILLFVQENRISLLIVLIVS